MIGDQRGAHQRRGLEQGRDDRRRDHRLDEPRRRRRDREQHDQQPGRSAASSSTRPAPTRRDRPGADPARRPDRRCTRQGLRVHRHQPARPAASDYATDPDFLLVSSITAGGSIGVHAEDAAEIESPRSRSIAISTAQSTGGIDLVVGLLGCRADRLPVHALLRHPARQAGRAHPRRRRQGLPLRRRRRPGAEHGHDAPHEPRCSGARQPRPVDLRRPDGARADERHLRRRHGRLRPRLPQRRPRRRLRLDHRRDRDGRRRDLGHRARDGDDPRDRRLGRQGARRQPVRRGQTARACRSRSRRTSMLSGATATVTDSVLKANGGDVTVSADNTSTLEALMKTIVESPSARDRRHARVQLDRLGLAEHPLQPRRRARSASRIGTENPAQTIAQGDRHARSRASGAISVTATSLASIIAIVNTAATTITASLTNEASVDRHRRRRRDEPGQHRGQGVDRERADGRRRSVHRREGRQRLGPRHRRREHLLASSTRRCSPSPRRPTRPPASRSPSASRATRSRPTSPPSITGVPSVTATGGNITVSATQSSAIDATSTASASPSRSASGRAVAFSGGGATAVNKIGGNTNATHRGRRDDRDRRGAPDRAPVRITISATNSSTISATGPGARGRDRRRAVRHDAGIAIGFSLARNLIGWAEYGGCRPARGPGHAPSRRA